MGIRAAAISVSARAFSLQSQRATRPFAPDFHPLPPHDGQTSAATFMKTLSIECALCGAFPQVLNTEALWQSCGVVAEVVENVGKRPLFTSGTQGRIESLSDESLIHLQAPREQLRPGQSGSMVQSPMIQRFNSQLPAPFGPSRTPVS